MNRLKKYLSSLIAGAIVLSLSSCTSSAISSKGDSRGLPTADTLKPVAGSIDQVASSTGQKTQPSLDTVTSTPSPSSKPLNATNSKTTASAQSSNTVPITIYQADSQCQNLLPENLSVPAENPVEAAVGKVLKQADSGDFAVAGYRVNVNSKTGVATVDLRRSPNSKRQFVSLSPCEQFALFGSLRKTLTDSSQLKIKDVRFTEQGQIIKF